MSYIEQTKEFNEIYRKEIFPIFRNYEVFRKREIMKYYFMFAGGILIALGGFVAVNACFIMAAFKVGSLPPADGILMTLLIISLVGGFYLALGIAPKKIKPFALTIKNDCLPRLLKVFGDIKWYNDRGIIFDSELNSSGLFADYNVRTTDDEFKGSYNGVPFRICETMLSLQSGSGKNSTAYTVFKGVVISFKSNKRIKNRTIVSTKGDLTKKNSYWLILIFMIYPVIQLLSDSQDVFNWILFMIWGLGMLFTFSSKQEEALNRVTLEDSIFSNQFDVYSSDQVEARYLVTPAFMERFKALKTAFGAKKAKCSFNGDKIIFAISTEKNLFEIGSLFKSLEDPKSINEFYNELSSILKMVEYFKLDEKIGL